MGRDLTVRPGDLPAVGVDGSGISPELYRAYKRMEHIRLVTQIAMEEQTDIHAYAAFLKYHTYTGAPGDPLNREFENALLNTVHLANVNILRVVADSRDEPGSSGAGGFFRNLLGSGE